MPQPNLLIIGAHSFIGKYFIDFLKKEEVPFTSLNRRDFDFLSPDFSSYKLQAKPFSHALITAACAKISYCEKYPEESYQINVKTPLLLAKHLVDLGIQPIFFSSDYVFDGKRGNYHETSPLSPLNHYGKQKAKLEESLPLITQGNHLLLRLSKIFSHYHDHSLLNEMIISLLNKKPLRVASDQVFSPLAIDDFNPILLSLIKKNKEGTFNIGGKKAISRYLLAKQVAIKLEAPLNLIEEISLDNLDEPFERPKNTSLNINKVYKLTNHHQIFLEESIYRCILALRNRPLDKAALRK